ncbi:PIN domain-containing protein [Mycena maculata]|uniref:PIN domain-containing protein n=1 Tax=Mycena maculata TaxID=230809 RepID=A0AAD7JHM2_9AGAR|nr:PIN domain-containing protein [Mycena maculata]
MSTNFNTYNNGPIPPPLAYTNSESFHGSTSSSQALNNSTLQRIDDLVQDVEMQAPVDRSTTCIVVDTNILLSHLKLLQQFTHDVERAGLSILVIIPGAVLNELDGQKKSDHLGWFARRASSWLYEKVKQRKSVRGQTNTETLKPSGNWRIRRPGEPFGERGNDVLILDCCMYFQSRFRTVLCSADQILCTESESQGIRSIGPRSGRELAGFLLGEDLDSFAPYQADYTGIESLQHEQDDGMDVDEEEPKLTAEQALDLLHIQIIDHFTRRLVELVGRVGGPALEDWYPESTGSGVTASKHAPKWKSNNKPYTAADCIEYLDQKKRVKKTFPKLEVFLGRPYRSPGARCGREWSYEAWSTALDALKQVGDDWNEPSFKEDLEELGGHREAVFGVRR